jgi:hypothetical protein
MRLSYHKTITVKRISVRVVNSQNLKKTIEIYKGVFTKYVEMYERVRHNANLE